MTNVHCSTVHGNNETFTGDRNTITGNNLVVHGSRNSITGANNTVYGDRNAINGPNAAAYGDRNSVSGFNASAHGNRNSVGGMNGSNTPGPSVSGPSVPGPSVPGPSVPRFYGPSIATVNCTTFLSAPAPAEGKADATPTPFNMLSLEGNAEETEDPTMACVICLSNRKTVKLDPCKHVVFCVECARSDSLSRACPLCQKPFNHAEVVFM